MRNIIPDILTLVQYFELLSKSRSIWRCHNCGSRQSWKHGCYCRKADRDGQNLNPVPIQRLKCCGCGKTYSVLPECIPPRRWYLWKSQQDVLLLILSGESYSAIARKVLPSRSTISRWISHFKAKARDYADCLRSFHSELGRFDKFKAFWQECLKLWPLSKLMLNLNNAGVIIP